MTALEVIHQGRSAYVFGEGTADERHAALLAAGISDFDRANREWCAVRDGRVEFTGMGPADARECTRYVNIVRRAPKVPA